MFLFSLLTACLPVLGHKLHKNRGSSSLSVLRMQYSSLVCTHHLLNAYCLNERVSPSTMYQGLAKGFAIGSPQQISLELKFIDFQFVKSTRGPLN